MATICPHKQELNSGGLAMNAAGVPIIELQMSFARIPNVSICVVASALGYILRSKMM